MTSAMPSAGVPLQANVGVQDWMVYSDDSKPKLMVVDDEVDNLALLYRTFRRDFQVYRAESGHAALQLLEQEGEMAIIISDQRMPKMSGIEFLSRTVDPFPDTIRMVLTGYTDVHDLVEAINNGKVFKYITKPWDARELLVVVQQAAETYRAVKQRTNALNRALRRESLFNAVMTAIRESLDYGSMVQTIVETVGKTFAADICSLHSVKTAKEGDRPLTLSSTYTYWTTEPAEAAATVLDTLLAQQLEDFIQAVGDRQVSHHRWQNQGQTYDQLIIPLITQHEVLAVLCLHKSIAIGTWSSEDIDVLKGVAEQAALAIAQAKLYQQVQTQTQQMQAELEVARQIQTNLLRQQLPELDTVHIQACCYPAREVGGDFFEVFQHPQGDLWLAVGDVSGKGVPAALFMASAISVLRRELSLEVPSEPNIILQNLNHSLLDDLVQNNCFITMVLARYTPSAAQLTYANAGHIYPLLWRYRTTAPDAQPSEDPHAPRYLKTRGVPLGILPTWMAQTEQLTLEPGEVFLLASDGITEAFMDLSQGKGGDVSEGLGERSMLRQEGLWQLMCQQSQQLERLSLPQILAEIRAQNPVQEDDQTILSLEVL
jgi:serine phosphatase RsbU (regulator of sigma subunit)/CheY-like chemotaxis protein